jgi:membrane protein DedA with SNARE-associated domain
VSELHDAIGLAAPYLNRYGYAAVFGALLLESFGLPLPGEAMLIAGAALAAEGELHLLPLLVCAWLAAVLGDNIGFAIGHFGGRRLIVRHGARIGITEPRLARVEMFFQRYGGGVVLVARFFALLRQLNGIVAGSVGMSWWRFLAYNAVGAALWVGAWGFGAYRFGQSLGHAMGRIHGLGYVLGLLALILLVAGIALHGWRRGRAPETRHPG